MHKSARTAAFVRIALAGVAATSMAACSSSKGSSDTVSSSAVSSSSAALSTSLSTSSAGTGTTTGTTAAPTTAAATTASTAGSHSASATASTSASPSAGAPAAATACTPAGLKTKKAGTFTFGTDNPVYEPWFVKNDPTSGKGFESAVAYAVAGKLGYAKSAVKWTRVSFNAAIAPGPKTFDADLNEVSITAQRAKFLDFSTGYYDVTQAIVTTKGSPIANVKTIAGLRKAKLGAQVGTTSYEAIVSTIRPNSKPAVFNSNDDAVQALKNGQIEGLVVDLPTAFYVASAQLDSGVIVGQLPSGQSTPEQFGLVLDKGSSLTSCVSKAVDALRKDGTLTKLATTWLSQKGAPKLS